VRVVEPVCKSVDKWRGVMIKILVRMSKKVKYLPQTPVKKRYPPINVTDFGTPGLQTGAPMGNHTLLMDPRQTSWCMPRTRDKREDVGLLAAEK